MIFGMPRALFPFLARRRSSIAGPAVVGLLFAAPAVGALLGALTGGWVGRPAPGRRGDLGGRGVGRRRSRRSALVGRAPVARLAVPRDRGRGRRDQRDLPHDDPAGHRARPPPRTAFGIHILVVTGGPRLGDLEAGLVAAAVSPMRSVVSGGLACIAGAAARRRSSTRSSAAIAPRGRYASRAARLTTLAPWRRHRAADLVELRVLDGPNLYFPRPAVKLTLAVPGWLARRRGRAVPRRSSELGVPGRRRAPRRGAAAADRARRIAARSRARLAAATGVRASRSGRAPGPEARPDRRGLPWRRRGAAEALGRETAPRR